MKLICLLIVAFMGAASAFAPSALVRSNAIGVRPAATVSMACRTNTKRDKFFRNLENAKSFRKASWKPAFKGGRGPPRGMNADTPQSKEDAAIMATIFVATDQSGEAIEAGKPEPALAA